MEVPDVGRFFVGLFVNDEERTWILAFSTIAARRIEGCRYRDIPVRNKIFPVLPG